MIEIRIQLSHLWSVLMIVYFVGDLLRIFNINHVETYTQTTRCIQPMKLCISMLMIIPILMLVLILILPQPVSRWTNIVLAGGMLFCNWVGLSHDLGMYDKFLIGVGIILNTVTLWLTWNMAVL